MGLSQTLEDFHQLVSQIVSLKRKSRRVMVTDSILITMEMLMDLNYCISGRGSGS